MTKILLLNGPPESGKDTIGLELFNKFMEDTLLDVEVYKFANPIRRAAVATFPHITEGSLDRMKSEKVFESGATLREWMIAFSEDLMKPQFGKDVFGKVLSTEIKRDLFDFAIVTDSGFYHEAKVLVDDFGPSNVALYHIHREGKTFERDSRSYIDLSDLGVQARTVWNEEDKVERAVESIMREVWKRGWLEEGGENQ